MNVVAAAYTPEIEAALEPFVYELVGEYFQGFKKHGSTSLSSSFVQGIGVRRTWDWSHEDACPTIFEEPYKYRVDEEDQGLV